MKKVKTVFVALIMLMAASGMSAAQEVKDSYSIGFLFADGYSDDNFKRIITDALDSISKQENVGIKLEWFTEEEDFMNAVKNGELDIVYPNRHDTLPPLMTEYGYETFMSLTVFANKKDPQNPLCLFAAKDLEISKIEDLRGKVLASYYTAEGNIFIRKMLGENPLEFFSEITPHSKGQQALDDVVAGKAQAAFVLRSNILAMKKINTTAARKIDTIACVNDFYDLPFLHRPDVPQFLLDKISSLLQNADKDEIFKPFWPMMRNFGLRFFPITSDKYDKMIATYKEAEENGWMEDYKKWKAGLD